MACGLESNLKPSSFVIKLHFVDIVIISLYMQMNFGPFLQNVQAVIFVTH